jgi:hypothetical protein
MNQNEFYKQQAKTLGEFFNLHGYKHITPVPSQANYDLVVQIMKQQGERNAKHLSK